MAQEIYIWRHRNTTGRKRDSLPLTLRGNTDRGPRPQLADHARRDLSGVALPLVLLLWSFSGDGGQSGGMATLCGVAWVGSTPRTDPPPPPENNHSHERKHYFPSSADITKTITDIKIKMCNFYLWLHCSCIFQLLCGLFGRC